MIISDSRRRVLAEQFVEVNLIALCREMKTFNETGLFGVGMMHELRCMCGFAGISNWNDPDRCRSGRG